MSKWLEDLLLNIEIWLYRRLRKLLQHGGTDFAVSLDTLHAKLAQKEQYRDGVYLHLKERLEGTDEHPLAEGVPVRPLPATQDLAHLQAAVELLDTRKVDVGDKISETDNLPEIADGECLPPLLCSSKRYNRVTKLVDNTNGWTLNVKNYASLIKTIFPNCEDITFGCEKINAVLEGLTSVPKRMYFPNATINIGAMAIRRSDGELYAPNLETLNLSGWNQGQVGPSCRIIYMPKCRVIQGYNRWFQTKSELPMEVMVFGKLESISFTNWNWYGDENGKTPNLLHFEVGDGTNMSLNLDFWLPTMALRTDTTASDYIYLREDKDDSGEFIYENNLQQFLANFKAYIADRLADRTGQSTLTLTLSQAVRDVLTAEIEDIIVSQKHWVISPAKSV